MDDALAADIKRLAQDIKDELTMLGTTAQADVAAALESVDQLATLALRGVQHG